MKNLLNEMGMSILELIGLVLCIPVLSQLLLFLKEIYDYTVLVML